MSPDLERLIALQQIDAAIADARGRIAAHPERLAEADSRLDAARRAVADATQRLDACQEARRTAEREAALYQTRLSKYKDQLSAVKTNREYQAMQVEIETAQRELGAAEERVLERMMEGDAEAAALGEARTALAEQDRVVAQDKERLQGELQQAESDLEAATAARAELVGSLESRLLTLYGQVARIRKGVAICPATRDGLCSVCHVRLRPHVFQQVRQNDTIVQCESCQRILYYVPPPVVAAEPAGPAP